MRTEVFKRGVVSILLVFALVFSMISVTPLASSGDLIYDPSGENIEVVQGENFLIRHTLEFDEPENGAYSITMAWLNYDNDPSESLTFVSATAYYTTGPNAGEYQQADVTLSPSPAGADTRWTLLVMRPVGNKDPRNGQFNVDITLSASGVGGVPHIPGDHVIPWQFGGIIIVEKYPQAWPRDPITIRVLQKLISISPNYQGGPPGTTLKYIVTVTNVGENEDNFNLTVSDSETWGPTLDDYTFENIPPGENRITTLRVTVPAGAIIGTRDRITVTVISQRDPNVRDNVVVEAIAQRLGIVRGKDTAYNITQTGDPPWYEYEIGDRPLVMVAKEIGSGGVVAAGIVPTCRSSPTPGWTHPANPLQHLDILFDEAFRWMVPGAANVLWYQGYNVYNTIDLCYELVEALGLAGYTVTADATMPITSGLLSAYDILVLPQLQLGTAGIGGDPDLLPDADVQAIKSFVEGGGGLFIMDGSDFGGHHYSKVMNKVLESLGFDYFFQDDQISDPTNNWANSDYRPIVDVDPTTDIGSAYQAATGATEIGLYSICSLAKAGPGVSLYILPDYQVGLPGATLEYSVIVSNPENPLAIDLTYDLTFEESADWSSDIHPTSVFVQVGESEDALLIVTIPDDAPMSTDDTIVVTATARGYPEVQTSFTTVAHAGKRIEPTDDTYVSDQDSDANYSGENSLRVGRYYEYWQWPYLKFDLSEIPSDANITDARLYLYAYYKYASGFDVLVHEVEDDDWMELAITWNNKPTHGALLDTKFVDAASFDSPKSYSWDVTSFVVNEFAGDQWGSFCLRPPDDLPESTSRAFWSNERYESRTHPFLRISYTTEVVERRVSVSVSPNSRSGSPGDDVTFTVTVRNEGTLDDSYSLTVTDTAGWSPSISPSTLTLDAGASDTATLTVTIPSGAADGATDTITVTATSQADPTVSDSASCVTHVIIPLPIGVAVSISPSLQSGAPGETLTFTVTVRNEGTLDDSYSLTVMDTADWSPSISPYTLTLDAGASGTATLTTSIPSDAAEGDSTTITVTATSQADPTVSDSATCVARAIVPAEDLLVEVGSIDVPCEGAKPAYQAIHANGEYVYGLVYGPYGHGILEIINVTDPTNPYVQSTLQLPFHNGHNLWYSDGYVYTAHRFGGLNMIDVSDPDNPNVVSSVSTYYGQTRGLRSVENYLYFSDGTGGSGWLRIYDVSSGALVQVGSHRPGKDAGEIAVTSDGNFAYQARWDGTQKYIRIYDVQDKTNPSPVGSFYSHPAGVIQGWLSMALSTDDKYLYVGSNLGLEIFDITNRTSPSLVENIDVSVLGHGVFQITLDAEDQILYVSTGEAGATPPTYDLIAIDVSNPSDASIIYRLEGASVEDIDVNGNYLYATSATKKLRIFAITLPPPVGQWDAFITATFSGGSDDAIFSVRPDATPGFDDAYDIPEPPPPVAPSYVRTFFYYPEQTPDELHRSSLAPEDLMEWPLRIEYAESLEDITLTWNVEDVPVDYSIFLYREENLVADMRAEDNYTFEASTGSYDFRIVMGRFVPFTLELTKGWNMISFPVLPENSSPDSIFGGYYVLYRWDAVNKRYVLHADSGSFIEPDPDVEAGVGYWAYVLEDENVNLLGVPVNQLTLGLRLGWNLIGPPYGGSSIADPADDPDNSVIPWAFTWNAHEKSYGMTQQLDAGKGYWVYAMQDCELMLNVSSVSPTSPHYEAIGTVDYTIDGDTIQVNLTWVDPSTTGVHTGSGQRVRFSGGIDAPELANEGGQEAKSFVRDNFCSWGTEVFLDLDNLSDRPYHDTLGRLLGVVYVKKDGKWVNVNAELLRWGLEEYPDHNWLRYTYFPSEFDPYEWLEEDYPYVRG